MIVMEHVALEIGLALGIMTLTGYVAKFPS